MGCFGCFGARKEEAKGGDDSCSAVHESKHVDKSSKVIPDMAKMDAQEKEASEKVPMCAPPESATYVKGSEVSDIQAQIFKLEELTRAANNFSADCLIGEGGFGPVYKGQLDNGQVAAIKQLNQEGLQGNREFLVEVLMLSLLHHENLVNLIGYCAEGDQRLLVYEYMPLGSLEDHLHDLPPGEEPLDWTSRMKIAAGAARGLEYLHDVANPPVIYRDLKSSNILLGEDYYPKLSDFGLAKIGPVGDKTHVSTRVMGTYGYCAPEYAMTGQLTSKSDVYSFGVVLLELITGRRAIDQSRPHGEHNLVAWARPLFKDRKKFSQMADPGLRGRFPVRGLFQALAVAAMCVHEQAASRPAIADVVTALNFLASQSCGPPPVSARPSMVISVPSAEEANSGTKPPSTVAEEENSGTKPPSMTADQQAMTTAMDASLLASPIPAVDGTNDTELERSSRLPVFPCKGKEREQAVAGARMWGNSLREKRGG